MQMRGFQSTLPKSVGTVAVGVGTLGSVRGWTSGCQPQDTRNPTLGRWTNGKPPGCITSTVVPCVVSSSEVIYAARSGSGDLAFAAEISPAIIRPGGPLSGRSQNARHY